MNEQPRERLPLRGDISVRSRWTAFAIIAAGATVVAGLLKTLAGFDWGVFGFGWTGAVGLGLFLALYLGRPTPARRWAAFGVIGLVGVIAALWLIVGAGLPELKVVLYGLVPFLLVMLGAVVFVRRRVAPHRVVQIIAFVLLNGFILAYLQGTVIYQGFFKYTLQPILNCYGGPLAVFACPLGSLQQIIGIHALPWLPLGVFLVVGAFVGRAACGWVCPFGLWQDLLNKIRIGQRAGRKRWLSFAVVAAVAGVVALLLVLLLRLSWWRVLLLGWLPFVLLVLYVVQRGKLDIPARAWVGGVIAALGLGVLIWFRLGPQFGVVAVAVGMLLLGLTGRWLGAGLAAATALLVGWLGGTTPLFFGLSGGALGLVLAGVALVLVLVLDVVLRLNMPSTWLKFGYLVVVAGVAAWFTAEPWFCKLCPQGTLGAGIPLVLWDPVNSLRGLVGWLYWVKIAILLLAVVAAISIKRPFCRLVCPIGAIYGLTNKVSLLRLRLEKSGCIDCSRCQRVCPMDIEPYREPNQTECIRCFECAWACPKSSLRPGV